MSRANPGAAHYHLPGLFEFYEFYSRFLPLFRQHREYFTIGVTSAPSMVLRRTTFGAEAG